MKLASIEVIKEIVPHNNADSLEIAKVLGWQSVVKKNEFKEGDKVVFVVIDTILPVADWSKFLEDKNNLDKPIRLKTIKLRGQYSQGLLLPLSVLPESVQSWHIGADVGGALGIKKYEKEIPACLSGEVLGPFPSYLISSTDEDNGLSNFDIVEEILKVNEGGVTITQKLDGSSCTIIIEKGKITQVCSRRLSLKESDANAFWIAAKKLEIEEDWSGYIQGELMGPGIQGNQLKLMQPTLYVFQVKEKDYEYYDFNEMANFCINNRMNMVPLIGFKTLDDVQSGIESLQELADSTVTPHGTPAEGIVVRPVTYKTSGNGRPLSFKIINRNYKD